MSGNVELRAILRDEITPTLTKIEAALAKTGSTGVSAGNSIGGAYMPIIRTSRQLTDELERNVAQLSRQRDAMRSPEWKAFADQQSALKREIASMTGETTSLGASWQGIAAKFYLASSAIQPLVAGMGSLVEAAKQYDSIRSRLNAAEGSSILGGQDFKEIQEMAKRPGLGFDQAASAMATLRGMKVTAAEAKQLILGIAQANASAAGTAEQFGGVMYQIQQSVSLGRLMSEDLKPIMQQIPTLGAAIQQHFGASQAEELNKRLKESGKSVRDFWLEVANLGQQLPATGETIANNIDNMGDAWVRFRAALADNDVIKGASRAMTGLLEKISEFLEKDKDVERAYIIRTKVIKAVQEEERGSQPGKDFKAKFAFDQKNQSAIMADILKAGAKKDSAEVKTGIKTLYQTAIDEYNAGADKLRAEKEAQEKKDRDKSGNGGGLSKSEESAIKAAARERARISKAADDEFVRVTGGTYATYSMLHPGGVDREDQSPSPLKTSLENQAKERERLAREIERKKKEIVGQEERVEKSRKRVADAIAKEEERRQKERLDNEKRFWERMKQSTTDGLAGILIAEQEGASWWSGIDGMRHRAVKAGITGATRMGLDWLAGGAGMFAGGPAGAALGAGGMEMLSSFLGFRAGGGHTMRAQVVGEDRAEVFRPTVPGTIYNNTQSTSYSGGITVILPNARSADDIARDLPRATRSASSNRRQTSR